MAGRAAAAGRRAKPGGAGGRLAAARPAAPRSGALENVKNILTTHADMLATGRGRASAAGQTRSIDLVGTFPAMEDQRPDWLARNGGWVLLVFGVLLVVVSVAIADGQALASILGFSGVAAAVFGVVLSRLEGDFEFSPTKFAATLTAARSAAVRDDLTLEERAELMLRVMGVGGDAQVVAEADADLSSTVKDPPHRIDDIGISDARPSLPRPRVFRVFGATENIHAVFRGFEQHVASTFRGAGWEVHEVRPAERGFDLVARKDDWTLFIAVKLGRLLSSADAQQFVATVRSRSDPPMARYVFAVNAGALSAGARDLLASVSSMLIWEVPVEGW
jgi:hypothetical protein